MGNVRKNMISVIIPVRLNDFNAGMMIKLRPFIEEAKAKCKEDVEIITVVNKPSFGRIKAKNFGAEKANGDILIFIDCDNEISPNFFNEVSEKGRNKFFVGGGVKDIRPSHYSLGFLLCLIPLGLFMFFTRITIGAFWVRKTDFLSIGGFREKKYDDIDFALRLKRYAKEKGRKFESLKKSFIIWSTRKFETHGDWHWLKGYHTD